MPYDIATFKAWATNYANQFGIPVSLFHALIQQESSWRPDASSGAGAYGLAQLLSKTARDLGVNRSDPQQNLFGGAKYLYQQYQRFGCWAYALAAYNHGPTGVQRWLDGTEKNLPAKTVNYVHTIGKNAGFDVTSGCQGRAIDGGGGTGVAPSSGSGGGGNVASGGVALNHLKASPEAVKVIILGLGAVLLLVAFTGR